MYKKISTLLVLLSCLVIWEINTGCTHKKNEIQGYNIGDVVEDFSLKNVDGKMVSLKDFDKAKGFIVIFTCNHCPYAKAYEQRIIDLDKKFKDMGYPVIAINPNDPNIVAEDSYDQMKKLAKKKGYTFPYLIDEKQEVYPKFGATKTPHVYLLTKSAIGIVVQYMGAIDDNYEDASAVKNKYVENAVLAIEMGNAPDPTVTKAIGCSIKAASK